MRLLLRLLLLLLLISCGNKRKNAVQDFLANLPSDTLLTIKTYDGWNQVVHPDVLWDGKKLIMGITPYPFYWDSLENPCLYTSKDGLQFNDFLPTKNPLVPAPKIDHNCDPDILFDKDSNLLLYYLETLRPFGNNVVLLKQDKSTRKFSRKVVLSYNLKKKEHLILSPAIIQNVTSKKYFIFFVDNDEKTNRIKQITSSTTNYFKKKKTVAAKIQFPKNYSPWHLDAIKGENGKYYLLTNGFYGKQEQDNYSLFLAESDDLIHWKNNREIFTKKDIPDTTAAYVYRSSAIITNETIGLWYSYTTNERKWKLGFKKLISNKIN